MDKAEQPIVLTGVSVDFEAHGGRGEVWMKTFPIHCIMCEGELPIDGDRIAERCPHCGADYSKSWEVHD